jgi:hypothetical protein
MSNSDPLLMFLFGKDGVHSVYVPDENGRETSYKVSSNDHRRFLMQNISSKQRSTSSRMFSALLFALSIPLYVIQADVHHCDPNCMDPRRPATEELFNALNHHERSETLAETLRKIDVRLNLLFE